MYITLAGSHTHTHTHAHAHAHTHTHTRIHARTHTHMHTHTHTHIHTHTHTHAFVSVIVKLLLIVHTHACKQEAINVKQETANQLRGLPREDPEETTCQNPFTFRVDVVLLPYSWKSKCIRNDVMQEIKFTSATCSESHEVQSMLVLRSCISRSFA